MPIRKQLLLTCSENKGGKCEEKRKKKEEESGATWKNKTRKKSQIWWETMFGECFVGLFVP